MLHCVSSLWDHIDARTVALLFSVWWITQWLISKGYIFTKGAPPPGLYEIPLFGSVPYFVFSRRTVLENIEKLAEKYGPVFR